MELLKVEVVGAWEIAARGELEGEFRVVERAQNVWNDGFLVDRDREYLTLSVDADDAVVDSCSAVTKMVSPEIRFM